tara:strand:+ start:122 stop:340 length:219 start_codon:yes stop_codon:yes gene_type:complete
MGLIRYIQEAYEELMKKVSWPSFSDLQSSAVVVAVASAVIALIIFLMDYVMGNNSDQSFWKGFLGYFYSIFS